MLILGVSHSEKRAAGEVLAGVLPGLNISLLVFHVFSRFALTSLLGGDTARCRTIFTLCRNCRYVSILEAVSFFSSFNGDFSSAVLVGSLVINSSSASDRRLISRYVGLGLYSWSSSELLVLELFCAMVEDSTGLNRPRESLVVSAW